MGGSQERVQGERTINHKLVNGLGDVRNLFDKGG